MAKVKMLALTALVLTMLAPAAARSETNCADGLDNDANGLIDCLDPTCCANLAVCNGQPCDDGAFCTVNTVCSAGTCTGGAALNCADAIDCTIDSCNEALNQCDHVPDHSQCSDDVNCTGTQICNPASGCEPGVDNPCDDFILCTVDVCQDLTCSTCLHIPVDACCNDGKWCNGEETCNVANFGCTAGPPPIDCSGQIGTCATQFCNETTQACSVLPNNAACNNGAFCDGIEWCDLTGACQPGEPVDCSGDESECASALCSELSHKCEIVPQNEGATCTDGDPCTDVSVCVQGVCEAEPHCGDGVYNPNPACQEECDNAVPPCLPGQNCEICDNMEDDDGDGLVDCLDTYCAPTFGQPITCSSTCSYIGPCKSLYGVRGKIQRRQAPASGESVAAHLLRLRGHVTLTDTNPLDPLTEGFGLRVSNTSDGELYRVQLSSGDLTLRRPGRYRFSDRSARSSGSLKNGLAALTVKIKPTGAQQATLIFRAAAWSDIEVNNDDRLLTVQITGVGGSASLTGTWRASRNGGLILK